MFALRKIYRCTLYDTDARTQGVDPQEVTFDASPVNCAHFS